MAKCRCSLVLQFRNGKAQFSIVLHSGTFLFTVAKAYILSTEKLNFCILYEFVHLCSRDLLCRDSLAIVLNALVPEYGTWYMLDNGNVL